MPVSPALPVVDSVPQEFKAPQYSEASKKVEWRAAAPPRLRRVAGLEVHRREYEHGEVTRADDDDERAEIAAATRLRSISVGSFTCVNSTGSVRRTRTRQPYWPTEKGRSRCHAKRLTAPKRRLERGVTSWSPTRSGATSSTSSTSALRRWSNAVGANQTFHVTATIRPWLRLKRPRLEGRGYSPAAAQTSASLQECSAGGTGLSEKDVIVPCTKANVWSQRARRRDASLCSLS